jgi:hypothetical protein
VLKIHLAKPLNDLKTLFWDMAVKICGNCALVAFPEDADIIVVDDFAAVSMVYRECVDIVVIGVDPIPERENVFFLRTHERMRWFLERVPRRHCTCS